MDLLLQNAAFFSCVCLLYRMCNSKTATARDLYLAFFVSGCAERLQSGLWVLYGDSYQCAYMYCLRHCVCVCVCFN
jgi:hypothetical protein